MGTHPIFESDFDCLTELSKFRNMTTAVDVSISQDGGVMKTRVNRGEGEVTPDYGSEVTVHYTGTLTDGTQFDSSRGRGEFTFTLGEGQVIKGWDEGVKTMKKNERAKFTLAPEYAYGENGSPPKIGQNQTLIFDIELLSWKAQDISEQGDRRLTKSVVKKGQESWIKVADGSECTVTVKMVKDITLSVIHDYGQVKFEVGEAEMYNLPAGLNQAVKKMQRGEISRIGCAHDLALGEHVWEKLKLKKQSDVLYEVQLKNYEKVQEAWEMNDEEKINQATIYKDKGTKRFKEQQFKIACGHYARVVELLTNQEANVKTDEGKKVKEQFDALKLAANLNMALVYTKYDENYSAINAATDAIGIDANNEKAHFRRGDARIATRDYEKARDDFKRVIEINPENKLAAKKLKQLADQIKKEKEAERKRFEGKLFG